MVRKADGDTKGKIVDAAYKVLAEQGYDKTSMKEIAREAGVAQGLINYYFPSKEDLLFEVFHMETFRYSEEMDKISELPITETFIRDALEIPKNMVHLNPDWHRLRYELFAIGLRSKAGLEEVNKSLQAGREQVFNAMALLPLSDQVNKDAVASIIIAVTDGLALEQLANPDFDADAAYLTLAEMLELHMLTKNDQKK